MSLETKFNDFKTKHDLDDSAIAELLKIFNDSFIDLAHKLLNEAPSDTSSQGSQGSQGSKKYSGPKKFATKIAAEYADENNVTLDMFQKEKITKKDIDEFIKSNKISGIPKLNTELRKKETPIKHGELCKGLTKNGEPCNRLGTEKPEGSKNCFCFRHALDWKNYEISSDSDLHEEDVLEDSLELV